MRFVREARVQGQLEHPSIVPVYDLGVEADGQVYFTMKLLNSGSDRLAPGLARGYWNPSGNPARNPRSGSGAQGNRAQGSRPRRARGFFAYLSGFLALLLAPLIGIKDAWKAPAEPAPRPTETDEAKPPGPFAVPAEWTPDSLAKTDSCFRQLRARQLLLQPQNSAPEVRHMRARLQAGTAPQPIPRSNRPP
jgi:hypothetical protein